ncbi:TolC family outer membrane protein [Altererythrobacter sp. GH1-8]|uniref:TolC family outer membrane protein n=1 Tax=Altererythrobacter sp. GH1-8 TaxID=3349333 RepID=UPI00374D4BB7
MQTGRLAVLLAVSSALVALPAQAETLRDALVMAYNTSPALKAAQADLRATDENVVINEAQGLPRVDVTANHIEFVKTSPNSFTAPERRFQIGPDLQIPIYSGGATRNAIKASKGRVDAGQADLRGTEGGVFLQVVAAYMDVLRTEALVALNTNQVEVLTVNLEATRDRFQIGELTRTDVAQSESRLAQARGNLMAAQSNLIGARETYIQLVGKAPGDLETPPPLPGLPDTVGDAVVIALENNPDLIAAKARAKAAGFESEVAGSGRLPTVSGFASYDYADYFGTLGGPIAADLLQTERTANVGVQVTIPIFQGGLPAARQRQAFARETAALETVVAVERDVIRETRAAYAYWQAANAIIKSAEAAVEAAELSLEGVRAENSIGNRSILDVLNAEQELVLAQSQLVTATRDAYVAGFSLLTFMGRAEARDLNLDMGGPLYDPQLNYERVRGQVFDWQRDPEPAATTVSTVDIPAPDASIAPDSESPVNPESLESE